MAAAAKLSEAPPTRTLGEALVAAQQEMPSVSKDSTNPHFKNRFVSLDNLIAQTRPVLNRHGLAIMQFPSVSDLGAPTLTTRITHVSGEHVESQMPLYLGKQDMQGFGSAITYARRYAWAAALGIAADEDDDGEQAARPPAVEARVAPKFVAPRMVATKKQTDEIVGLIAELDATGVLAAAPVMAAMRKEYGTDKPEKLSKAEAENLIARLQAKVPA